MCGIAALIDKSLPSAASVVQRMITAQSHRGPDGAGIASCSPSGHWSHSYAASVRELSMPSSGLPFCVLGHNLLAIQDTGSGNHQPMFDGSLGMVFNGEIYNFIELRQELQRSGETFSTKTDTEVLLKLWKREGSRCVSKLRGMFSFLVYEPKDDVLWAVRDPFGIKPLYYASTATTTVLASEIRAIHASKLIARSIDEQSALACVAAGINNFGANTLYKSVRELPPGCMARIDSAGISVRQYYSLPFAAGDINDDSAFRMLRSATAESVSLHLRSARKTATCLSGGLDSSTVLSLISEAQSGKPCDSVSAYTVDSGSGPDSEVSLARAVALEFGSPHIAASCTGIVTPKDVFDMIVACETPNHKIGPINQFLLLREIAADGVAVVLDGQGGDELLSGYPWYWSVLIRDMEARGVDVSTLRAMRSKRICLDDNALRWYDTGFHDIDLWVRELMGGESFLGATASMVCDLPETADYLRGGGEWQSFRQREYMRGELQYLLRQEDRIGMWFGIECRVPFVDRVLVDSAGHLSPESLIRDGYLKYPFRVMIPEIPEQVKWSTFKRGYWETSATRYPWLFEISRQLVLESPVLQKIFPRLNDFSPSLKFDQVWRLLQIAVLEQCSDGSDVVLLSQCLAERNGFAVSALLEKTDMEHVRT